jgi:hypothetical protein
MSSKKGKKKADRESDSSDDEKIEALGEDPEWTRDFTVIKTSVRFRTASAVAYNEGWCRYVNAISLYRVITCRVL